MKDTLFRLFKKKPQPNDNQILLRAERAYRTLKSEGFEEALQEVENAIWERFFASSGMEHEEREALYNHIKGVQMVKAQLEAFVQQGEYVKREATKGFN